MASPELNFITEAKLTLQEVNYAIKEGRLSSVLSCNERMVYINMTTKENQQFCIRLDMNGFQVVSNTYDTIEEDTSATTIYETVYALLETISSSYRQEFSSQLTNKLLKLEQK